MTQTKIRANHFKGRLFKSAASSALALSALAGGVMLSGGKAEALECTFAGGVITSCAYGPAWPGNVLSPIPPGPAPAPVIVAKPPNLNPPNGFYEQWYETNIQFGGQSYYYPTDKDIWFVNGPTGGSGVIEWSWDDVNDSGTWLIPPDPHSVDEWIVDVDFKPALRANSIPPPPSIFEYVVIIDKGQGGVPHLPWNEFFEDVTLSVNFGPGSGNPLLSYVTKDIWSAVCTSSTPGGIFDACSQGDYIGQLKVDENTIGATVTKDITASRLDKLYIKDVAVINNKSIDNYQNIYRQVPGPLPILGASLALGSVRKLRNLTSRLKVHSMG